MARGAVELENLFALDCVLCPAGDGIHQQKPNKEWFHELVSFEKTLSERAFGCFDQDQM